MVTCQCALQTHFAHGPAAETPPPSPPSLYSVTPLTVLAWIWQVSPLQSHLHVWREVTSKSMSQLVNRLWQPLYSWSMPGHMQLQYGCLLRMHGRIKGTAWGMNFVIKHAQYWTFTHKAPSWSAVGYGGLFSLSSWCNPALNDLLRTVCGIVMWYSTWLHL